MKPADAQNSNPHTIELKRMNLKDEYCNFECRRSEGDFIGLRCLRLRFQRMRTLFYMEEDIVVHSVVP